MEKNIIRKLRKINNMTVEELADRVGVSKNLITSWENGERDVMGKYVPILASSLGVDKLILYNSLTPSLSFSTEITKNELENLKKLRKKYENIIKHIDYLIEEIS